MCGICGLVRRDPRHPVAPDRLTRMRDSMTHRGPDDAGSWIGPGVGLAHRRLSIIDLSTAGRQPLTNEDGSILVVFNGEIYNYQALRAELLSKGHRFRTRTDTEVLVHLYEECGLEMVERLRGMFAFGLWDARNRRLVLVRDRLGIKPLYYTTTADGDLAFASEVKALVAGGMLTPRLNTPALCEYLGNRYTTGEKTLYADVTRLLPGHLAVWEDGALTLRGYWTLECEPSPVVARPRSAWQQEFEQRFTEAVKLRMISDAPIGVFLSGGLDSSAIAAIMTRHAEGPIQTFSVAFAEREANELSYARAVAQALGARHHEVVVSRAEFFEAAPRLVWYQDEPLAFPSNVPLYFVSRLATDHVKVVLTGEGSDELLAGYGKYWRTLYNWRLARAYDHFPAIAKSLTVRALEHLPGREVQRRLRRTFFYLPATLDSLHLANYGVFGAGHLETLLTSDARAEIERAQHSLDPFADHRRIFRAFRNLPLLDQLLALDITTYLHELLMKQDRMSMAASIESRVPFLDHPLVEFAMRLPPSLKLRGWSTKHVLRKAMKRVLPASILNRRKLGFPTPLSRWLRDDPDGLLRDTLLSARARQRGLFDPGAVAGLIGAHRSGAVDHTERLWALLNMEWWFEQCTERPAGIAWSAAVAAPAG